MHESYICQSLYIEKLSNKCCISSNPTCIVITIVKIIMYRLFIKSTSNFYRVGIELVSNLYQIKIFNIELVSN